MTVTDEPYGTTLHHRLHDQDRLDAVRDARDDLLWRRRAKTIVDLAAQMLDTEIAHVNLVTATSMHSVASAAGGERVVEVGRSYCQHVVGTGAAVVVYESLASALVRDSPTAQRLRCYLGIPLVQGDQVLGALCVAGTDPREWTELEVALLTELTQTLQRDVRSGR